MAVIYTTLEETFRNIKIVKAFTNERQERHRYHENSKNYLKKAMKIAGYDSLVHPMTEVLGIVTFCIVMLAGAWLVLLPEYAFIGHPHERSADKHRRICCCSIVCWPACADPLRKLSDVFSRLQAASAACDRIFARLEREPSGPRSAMSGADRPASSRLGVQERGFCL